MDVVAVGDMIRMDAGLRVSSKENFAVAWVCFVLQDEVDGLNISEIRKYLHYFH